MAVLFGLGGMRVVMGAVMALIAVHTGFSASFLPRSVKGVFLARPRFSSPSIICLSLRSRAGTLPSSTAARISMFLFECLAVGFFEEVTFRGIVFPLLLQKTGTSVKGRFIAILGSAAMFGLLHAVNLLNGFSGAVFLQMGYSFLIGAMLAVAMFAGAGVIFCALVHGVYNFCGMLISELGQGGFSAIWNVPEIILTAAVALAVIAYFVVFTLKSKGESARELIALPEQE